MNANGRSIDLTSKKTRRRAGPAAASPIGRAARLALADDTLRMLEHEPAALRFDEEGVHQMRTSVRRLRSDLKFFGAVLDAGWARPLRDELKWLAGALGAVRDLDVLDARLREAAGAVAVVEAAGPAFAALEGRRDAARSALGEAMASDRYAALRRALIAAARSPERTDDAGRPAGVALMDLLERSWSKLRSHAEEAPPDAPEPALHEFRKRAKKVRYAAESAADALGDRAGRHAKRVGKRSKEVQRVLGDLQDAAVAAGFLDEVRADLSGEAPASSAIAALIAFERDRAERAREAYIPAWRALVGP